MTFEKILYQMKFYFKQEFSVLLYKLSILTQKEIICIHYLQANKIIKNVN